MNADPTAPDPRAGIVQQLLLAALLGLALLVLVLLLRELRPLVGGERAPARVAAWTGEQTMALEVHRSVLDRAPGLPRPQEAGPVHEEHRLVELPIPPYLWAGIGDPVTLAWDPAAPQRARVLDLGANGVPVAAQAALLLLLALASQAHLRHHSRQTSSESITCKRRSGVVSRLRLCRGGAGGVDVSPAAASAAAPRHRR